jgi:hypothetical protein
MGKVSRIVPPAAASDLRGIEDIVLPAAQVREHFEAVRREHARRERRDRWQRRLNAGVIIGLAGVAAVEGGVILRLLPLKQWVPVFVSVRADGTAVSTVQWDELPDTARRDATVNTVWTYVMNRESWSEANAGWAYTVVSAMSAPPVREQYQQWIDPANPKSPQRLYGGAVSVEARFVRWEPVCPIAGCDDNAPAGYRIWFDRIETPRGRPPGPPVRYAAAVQIRRNVPLPNDRQWQRWTFNAPLIQVTGYPGPQREGVTN